MPASGEFLAFLQDQLGPVGPVSIRRMFGGAGVFKDGVMFALVADEVLYLKVGPDNRTAFEAAGMEPFTYTGKGKPVRMSYYECPPDALEDPEDLRSWAEAAIAAARAARR